MRVRPKLEKQPEWDGRFEGWTKKFVAKNMWRCEGHDRHEKFRDLMQDAYITFRHVLKNYPLVTEPKHIMSLYQRTMINEYHDKAKYRQRKCAVEMSLETIIGGEDQKLIDSLGEENNEGFLKVLISELPPEVRAFLDAFHDDEKLALFRKPVVQSRLAKLAGLPAKTETLNEEICRFMRVNKNIDFVSILQSALSK